MALNPELAPLLELINAGTPLHELSVADARAAFRALTVDMRPPAPQPLVARVEETTVAGADGPLPARVYHPLGDAPAATVVLFHGGGFVIGDLDTHDHMAQLIAKGTNSVVVSVAYRLAPEHPWPAAAEDAIAATRAVLEAAAAGDKTLSAGSGIVAVAGDSAGGNLAAIAAQQVAGVSAQFLIYPATDVTGDYPSRTDNAHGYFLEMDTMAWFIHHYATDPDQYAHPLLSPLYGPLGDAPPAVVITAELDPLRDEGEAYGHALTQASIEVTHRRYDGLIHGFFDMDAISPACAAAVAESIDLFANLLHQVQQ